jgi:peptidyl-Lys metalloendopeptidase
VEFEHVLGGVYNFTTTGAGAYEIVSTPEASTFTHVTASGELVSLHADIVDSHSATLNGKLTTAAYVGPSAKRSRLSGRDFFVGCSSSRQSILTAAATNAQTYANNAYKYLARISGSTTYVSGSLKISLKI